MTIQQAIASASDTLDQTSYTQVDSMTLTPGAGDYLAVFSMNAIQNASPDANLLRIAIFVNGVEQTHTVRELGGDTSLPATETSMVTHCLVSPTAGQVVDVKYQITSGASFWCTYRELTLLPAEQGTYQDTATADDTTSSGSWNTLNSMTRTPAAGDYLVIFTTHAETAADEVGAFRINVGGSPVTNSTRFIENEGSVENLGYSIMLVASISPNGSQAVEIEWLRSSGSNDITCHQRTMTLIEVDSADISQIGATSTDADSTTSDVQIDDMLISAPGDNDYLVLFSAYRWCGTVSGDQNVTHTIRADGATVTNSNREFEHEASLDDSLCSVFNTCRATVTSGNIQAYWQSDVTDTREIYDRIMVAVADPNPVVTNFPVIAGTNTSTDTSGTTHTVSLPGSIDAGDLLLIFFATDGDNTVTNWNGFTELDSESNGTANFFAIAYKYATGGEGGTIDITTSVSEPSAHCTYRITGHDDGQIPEASTVAESSSNTPDPTICTPTGGPKDFLWIAAAGCDRRVFIGYPSGYNLSQVTDGGGGANDCSAAACGFNKTGTSETPGTFTIASSDTWIAWTVAVHPSVAVTTSSITKTINARILKASSITKTIDAVIKRLGESITKNINARVLREESITKNIDARILRESSITKTIDAVVFRPGMTITKTIDARILRNESITKTIDARVKNSYTITKNIDARVKRSFSITKTIDSRVKNSYNITKNIDARVKRSFSITKTINSRVKRIENITKNIDARVKNTYSITKTIDINVTDIAINNITKTIDARIKRVGESITKTIDARILRVGFITKTVDAVVFRPGVSITKTIDARIKNSYFITKTINAVVFRSGVSITRTIDARILRNESITKTIDAVVFRPGVSITRTIDARILRTESITKTINSRILRVESITKNIDARVKNTYSITKTIDAQITGGISTNDITKTVDARIKRIELITKTIDARILRVSSITKTIDTRVLRVETITKTIDARVKVVGSITKTINIVVFRPGVSITKTIDARIKRVETITKTIDARVKRVESITKNINIRILKTSSITKTIDARVSVLTTSNITKTLDARILRIESITKNINARIMRIESITKTIDIRIKNAFSVTKTIDITMLPFRWDPDMSTAISDLIPRDGTVLLVDDMIGSIEDELDYSANI